MFALVSIIINNYNYSRFLGEAIESALAQTHSNVELIVVDDGSTDGSRDIISTYADRYPDRLRPVFKPNGGQASALNAGFAQSSGEIVIFLDADDVLLHEVAAQVAQKFSAHHPTNRDVSKGQGKQREHDLALAKVQFPLETIDESGCVIGLYRPQTETLSTGDLRREALTFPDDLRWQPTSGNAFARWVLLQILPMPEAPYRLCADYYLSNLPALFGAVDRLETIGARYRVHASNNHNRSGIDLQQSREIIERTIRLHQDIGRFAQKLGLRFPRDPLAVPSVTFIAQRLVSLTLEPARHPVAADTRASLLRRGIRAAVGRFDVSWAQRMQYVAWFCLFYCSAVWPSAGQVNERLAELFFFPNQRAQILRELPLSVAEARRFVNRPAARQLFR